MKLFIIFLYGFAWAIGGEKYFGKYRRGLLVLIPSVMAGIVAHLSWQYYLGIAILVYPVYQGLFFDKPIKVLWPESGTSSALDKAIGYLLLWINGVMAGALPALLWTVKGAYVHAAVVLVLSGLAFVWICIQSNSLKWSSPIYIRIGEVKIFCPADSWWLACFEFGLILGLLCTIGL